MRGVAAVAIAVCVLAGAAGCGGEQQRFAAPALHFAAQRYAYPLKVSKNRRYLVDQRGRPFMIVGDAPQSMIGNLSLQDAAMYIRNRRRAGFNTLWVSLICVEYNRCRADGTTYDGIKPFTTEGDLSTPNPKYFARADAMLRLAARSGMIVFLDPIETGGWLDVLRHNGVAKARAYGRFVGRRYRRFKNIVWMSGNDFQTWRNRSDDALVLAVAKGIRSVDKADLQTVELNYPTSGSLDDARWRPVINIDAAYTYWPTYAQVLKEYNRPSPAPVVMVEAGYEFEQNEGDFSKGDPPILRRQEYWTALSGAAGQLYGSKYTWPFPDGWKTHLNTTGAAQLGYLVKLFAGRRWFQLVPDQQHKLVTDGYGTFKTSGNVGSSDYVTTAAAPDGTLAVSYLPDGGTITVDLSRLRPGVRARWYDPTNGKFRPAAVPKSQSAHFSAPGENAAGDRDWVLLLTAA